VRSGLGVGDENLSEPAVAEEANRRQTRQVVAVKPERLAPAPIWEALARGNGVIYPPPFFCVG
jgi:hypothetical protein